MNRDWNEIQTIGYKNQVRETLQLLKVLKIELKITNYQKRLFQE